MARRFRFRSFRRSPQDWSDWVEFIASGLHSKTQWRLPLVIMGILLARGRRTVSTWLRAAGLTKHYSEYYYFIYSLGRKTKTIGSLVLQLVMKQLPLGERIVLALDDTPTRRYGPKVEGAGLHHNPSSGPDDHDYVYGHIWVTLAVVFRHPLWHSIALPMLAKLYVKSKDIPTLVGRGTWKFQTKLQMAADMIEWAVFLLKSLQRPIWVVMDGVYACRGLMRRLVKLPVIVVSRLRKDAGLRSLPPARQPRQRGRQQKYGREKISLAKRAAHRQGWEEVEVKIYGKTVTKKCKTFLATWPVVGGTIRVVIVREEHGWQSFFCTNPAANIREILEAYGDRSTIEEVFHDVKELWGSGEQQVRNVWSNIACFNLTLWMYTLVELWAWNKKSDELIDRSLSPWDTTERRPSHADKRKALRLECLDREFQHVTAHARIESKLKDLYESLVLLAV